MTNLRLAVAPHDHVRFSDSVVGLAGKVREILKEPMTIDELQTLLYRRDSGWPGQVDFGKVVLAITLLYTIGAANITDGDRIVAI
ncbi:ABC-three component system middle component 6 [Aristophania vespae]|uniref:ABC-three component system middle component 6 n=1 Tax=Aristophania vespae TaxID=2697033 RepID=UPI00235127B6|nr:ABC-three component system middle component 6 [Aristophania vespae]